MFFFDEAHLLFNGASKAFLDQVQQVVRLVRSKGVGVFFVTQSPKDVPADVLGQLGHRVQHALRAFTPDDEKALKAAARTFPKTDFYDVEETLTTLGIGEALVTVLGANGAPTPPFATRLIPPASRMGPLTDAELAPRLATPQVKKYAKADRPRERARDAGREVRRRARASNTAGDVPAPRHAKSSPSTFEKILKSPLTRSVANQLTRSLMGALLGPTAVADAIENLPSARERAPPRFKNARATGIWWHAFRSPHARTDAPSSLAPILVALSWPWPRAAASSDVPRDRVHRPRLPSRRKRPELHLLLRLNERRLYVVENDVKQPPEGYPVAIGQPKWPTPTGRFQINEMVENPDFLAFDFNDTEEARSRARPAGPQQSARSCAG